MKPGSEEDDCHLALGESYAFRRATTLADVRRYKDWGRIISGKRIYEIDVGSGREKPAIVILMFDLMFPVECRDHMREMD